MKGKVTIELKDVNTGEIKKIEGENTVTDVISDIAKILGAMSCSTDSNSITSSTAAYSRGMATKFTPIAKKALGGLLLFNDTFSSSNKIIPSNVKVIASAGQETNVVSETKGSHIDMESGATEHGYKNVWEFGTAQANGTIKALSLTNFVGGFDEFSNGTFRQNGTIYIPTTDPVYDNYTYSNRIPYLQLSNIFCFYDDVNKEAYELLFDRTTKILTLNKYRLSFDSFKVDEWWGNMQSVNSGYQMKSPTPETVATLELTYTYTTNSYFTGKRINYAVCTDIENYKTTLVIPRDSSGTTTHYVEIDWTKMLADPTDPTAMVEKVINTPISTYNNSSDYLHQLFRNKYYYGRKISGSNTTCYIYIIDLTDNSYEEIHIDDYISGAFSFSRCGSGIDTEGLWVGRSESNGSNIIMHITFDGEVIVNTNRRSDYKGKQIHPLIFQHPVDDSNQLWFNINNRYIGTYYQLPTPITKTSNQVMKITYELIDA